MKPDGWVFTRPKGRGGSLRNRLLQQLAQALNGIGLRVFCLRPEGRSDSVVLLRGLRSGSLSHVKGYCRPDLPAHYREKFAFVLRRIASVEGQNEGISGRGTGLQGFAGVGFF